MNFNIDHGAATAAANTPLPAIATVANRILATQDSKKTQQNQMDQPSACHFCISRIMFEGIAEIKLKIHRNMKKKI